MFYYRFYAKPISMKLKKTFVALLLFCLASSAFAQESGTDSSTSSTEETYQPNLRGSLLFGVGFNFLNNAPAPFEISPWRSKSVNLYYLYEIRLGNSRFSFNPGFGLGLEKYQFKNNTILSYQNQVEGFPSSGPVLVMDTVSNVLGANYSYSKNRLAANYLDLPLELSFASNRTNPKAGLKLAVGGKVGFLFSSHTKIKYLAAADETRIQKLKQPWGLNRLRYGAHARIGFGSFNLYFEYQLSPMFDNEYDGPLISGRTDTTGPVTYSLFPDVKNYRLGLYVDLF